MCCFGHALTFPPDASLKLGSDSLKGQKGYPSDFEKTLWRVGDSFNHCALLCLVFLFLLPAIIVFVIFVQLLLGIGQ